MMKILKRIIFTIVILALIGVALYTWVTHRNAPTMEVEDIPEYDGRIVVELNKGKPQFTEDEITEKFFEEFTPLDKLGRCGQATACLDEEHMPDGERGSIGMVKPSGWQIEKYDFIDNGGYLFNRCHLIGWQLTGQNDEERNLITGTRYFNTEGMLPYENKVASYIRLTGNPVMYRVTPIFKGKELVCRGVQMEAYSAGDKGADVSFNVFVYNVQPGVVIDYKTGKSEPDPGYVATTGDGDSAASNKTRSVPENPDADRDTADDEEPYEVPKDVTFVLNTNTHKFHKPDCASVQDIRAHNRREFKGTRDETLEEGYEPCGNCKP